MGIGKNNKNKKIFFKNLNKLKKRKKMSHRITSSNEETTCPNIAKPTRVLAYYIQGGLELEVV